MYDFDLISSRIKEHNNITVTRVKHEGCSVIVNFLDLFYADFTQSGTGWDLGIYEMDEKGNLTTPDKFTFYPCADLLHCFYVIDYYLLKAYKHNPNAFNGLSFNVSSLVYRNPLATLKPFSDTFADSSYVGYIKVDNDTLEAMRENIGNMPKVYKSYANAMKYGKANGEGNHVISTSNLIITQDSTGKCGVEKCTSDYVTLQTPPNDSYIDKVRVANDTLKELNVTVSRDDNYIIATHSKLPVTVRIDLSLPFNDFVRNVGETDKNLKVYDYFVRDVKRGLLAVLPDYVVTKYNYSVTVSGNEIEMFVSGCNYYSIDLMSDTVNGVKLPHYKAIIAYLVADYATHTRETLEMCDLPELLEMVAKSMGYVLKADLIPTDYGFDVFSQRYEVKTDYFAKRNLSKLIVTRDDGSLYQYSTPDVLQTPKLMQVLIDTLKHFNLIGRYGITSMVDMIFGITVTPDDDGFYNASVKLSHNEKSTIRIFRSGSMWGANYAFDEKMEVVFDYGSVVKAKYPSQLVAELCRHAFNKYGCNEYVRVRANANTVTFTLYNARTDIQTDLKLAPFVRQLLGY